MNKSPLTLLTTLLLAQLCFSQSRENNLYLVDNAISTELDSKILLGIKIGPSVPIGEFGEIDINNEQAGLAKTGIQLNANIQYLLTESFYLLVEGGYSSNAVDEDELLLPYNNTFPSFVRISVTSKNWNAKTLIAAVGTRTAIDSKTYFVTKFGIGLQSMSAPSLTVNITDGSTTAAVSQSSSTSNNIHFTLGASIVAEISETTFFNIGLDYLRATHEFKNVAVNSSVNGVRSAPTEFFEFGQNVETVGITIGLSFKI